MVHDCCFPDLQVVTTDCTGHILRWKMKTDDLVVIKTDETQYIRPCRCHRPSGEMWHADHCSHAECLLCHPQDAWMVRTSVKGLNYQQRQTFLISTCKKGIPTDPWAASSRLLLMVCLAVAHIFSCLVVRVAHTSCPACTSVIRTFFNGLQGMWTHIHLAYRTKCPW